MTKKRKNRDLSKIQGLSSLEQLIDDYRSTGNGHYLKLTQYPTGDAEFVSIKLDYQSSLKKGGGATRKNESKSEMDLPTLLKSQRRAKRQVRIKLLCIQADHMLTLTYRENKTNLDDCWRDFRRFVRKMKKRYGSRFQYVCVPEYQKRGAVHFHLGIHGYYHANTVRRIWQSVVGEGNIDLSYRHRRGGKDYNASRIANYLSKYLTKMDSVDFNRRRYSTGGSICPPLSLTGWLAFGVSPVLIGSRLINSITRKDVKNVFVGGDRVPIVFIST